MNAIPLINNIPKTNINNEKQLRQEINTSLVALKKEAGTLEGLINEAAQMLVTINNRIATLENDTVKKSDIVDVVQSGNMNPVTSNAVSTSNAMPVNSVTSGNMHSVTSNAVAQELQYSYHNMYNGKLTDNIYVYRFGKVVSIQYSGDLKIGQTFADGETITTLPEEYRPKKQQRVLIRHFNPNENIWFTILTTGQINFTGSMTDSSVLTNFQFYQTYIV